MASRTVQFFWLLIVTGCYAMHTSCVSTVEDRLYRTRHLWFKYNRRRILHARKHQPEGAGRGMGPLRELAQIVASKVVRGKRRLRLIASTMLTFSACVPGTPRTVKAFLRKAVKGRYARGFRSGGTCSDCSSTLGQSEPLCRRRRALKSPTF